eukprot:TRINITY_DN8482_c0_g1_i4.p1 TRINITY_DN8482_c0_g1~~TRINITY_DN8482_c0_g1_i4.p1  ORF type:complete len:733 (-),score=56.52 TRINITY_DN8482_c0_g1_i4:603-2801(-)
MARKKRATAILAKFLRAPVLPVVLLLHTAIAANFTPPAHTSQPYIQTAHFKGLHPPAPISGTKIRSVAGAEALHSVLSCHSQKGTWRRNVTPRKLPWKRAVEGGPSPCDGWNQTLGEGEVVGLAADAVAKAWAKNASKAEEWKVPEEFQWEWEMQGCRHWEKFDYQKFCRAMNAEWGATAKILMVGGEHMFGMERRLFAQMVAGRSSMAPVVPLFREDGDHPGAESSFRYCYDALNGESVAICYIWVREFIQRNGERSWAIDRGFREYHASVFVINLELEDISMDEFTRSVEDTIKFCQGNDKAILVVYMASPLVQACHGPCVNMPPGGCANTTSQTVETYEAQNAVAKKVATDLGALYIDPNPALTLWLNREEGKEAPCISGCQPGVVDAWVALLYNAILAALKGEVVFADGGEFEGMASSAQEDADVRSPTTSNGDNPNSWWREWMASTGRLHGDNEEETLTSCQYKPSNSSSPSLPQQLIPGSKKVATAKDLEEVTNLFQCFARNGDWFFNSTPRVLPWQVWEDRDAKRCDERHEKAGGIWGEAANKVVQETGAEWNIRDTLKWEWQTNGCPLEAFNRENFCRLIGPGQTLLLLGDSLTAAFSRDLANALWMGLDKRGQKCVLRYLSRGTNHLAHMFYQTLDDDLCATLSRGTLGFEVEGVEPIHCTYEHRSPSSCASCGGAAGPRRLALCPHRVARCSYCVASRGWRPCRLLELLRPHPQATRNVLAQ